MKKNILLIASGSFLALQTVSAAAQLTPPSDPIPETEAETSTQIPTLEGEEDVISADPNAPVSDMDEVSREIDALETPATPSDDPAISETPDEEADGMPMPAEDHSAMDHSADDALEPAETEPETI